MRVLSRLFRRLFLEELEDAFYQGRLHFPGSIEPLQEAFAFAALLRSQEDLAWVVYAKPPFHGPQQAIEYLGRYTHRVAISNQRLLSDDQGKVSFQWKDYRHENRQTSKVMAIDAHEFIRRFLIHTLPPGFQRIRHFGFLANCHRTRKLALCRQLLIVPVVDLLPHREDCRRLLDAITRKERDCCPHCGIGTMIRIRILPRYPWPAAPPSDTS